MPSGPGGDSPGDVRPDDLTPPTPTPTSRFPAGLPVTGAWLPGDPVGNRRFADVDEGRPFALEGGGRLPSVTLAYETWGELDATASNAILVCHALTGDSHAAGPLGHGHRSPGWWDDLIGPGRPLDTDRWFVVCSNVLGGCQGSTGPASPHPVDGRPWGSRFPTVTIRDMVRAQARLQRHLGIERWLCVIGGSMGGMQVLEWGAMFPRRVAALAPLATCAQASAQQIAWSAVERLAIAQDPAWRGGDYYDAAPGEGPWRGLALAREIAQITYRSEVVFAERFGREVHDAHHEFEPWARFEIESYLDHHGQKLVRRFDANSYLLLSRAMDLHDLARGRGSLGSAFARITAPVFTASITSDTLYPPHQQVEIRDGIRAAGGRCEYLVIDSPQGHDGFLLETAALAEPLVAFLDEVEKHEIERGG